MEIYIDLHKNIKKSKEKNSGEEVKNIQHKYIIYFSNIIIYYVAFYTANRLNYIWMLASTGFELNYP